MVFDVNEWIIQKPTDGRHRRHKARTKPRYQLQSLTGDKKLG